MPSLIGKALVISLDDPYASRHGGTLRTRGIVSAIESVAELTHCVYPDGMSQSGHKQNEYRKAVVSALRRLKKIYLPMPTQAAGRDMKLRQRCRSEAPDLTAVCVLSQMGLAHASDPRYLWVDFMDLWSDFAKREASDRHGIARATSKLQSRWLEKLEGDACEHALLVTCAGWSDCAVLRKRGIDAIWLPNPLPDQEFRSVARQGDGTRVAGFLANFRYWPNRDAYRHLVENWLSPLLDAGWTVVVAGHESENLDIPVGVECLGPVGDVDEFYAKVDVTLAPVHLGGGAKVKVIESFSRGVPVIGTPFAFAGFPPELRSLGHIVPLAKSDFSTMPNLERVDIQAVELSPFRQSNFEKQLLGLLKKRITS
ncbi:glycosyltransferase family 4 protein [Williamsia herbipolensis]|uniref:glycosyltransferase family 4 protein n=1 Tax=Williamsia herbipolensis TaxID=1603258 RepID=UPI000A93C7A4|nr:glycosyltransferase family 4 protein [Williamsia herbipolensis]